MTSKQKIILVSVLVAVVVILVALGGYFIAVYSSSSGERTSNGFTYEVSGKTVTIISYSGSDATITVPAKIGGKRVAKIAKGAFSSSTATSIVFDDEISQITLEEECFKGQTTLTYVQLPSAIKEIPDSAFEDCTKLEHIVIPDGVTSIGANAFEGCTSLTYTGNDSNTKVVTLPAELTSLGKAAFKDCSKISSLKINAKLTEVPESAFEGCKLLATLDFGSESAVVRIADKAFYQTYVKEVKLPASLNTVGSYAFASVTNSSFKTLTVPASITQIGDYAFDGCTGLQTIEFEEGSVIKKLGTAVFRGCTALTKVTLPDTLTEIPSLAFYGCSKLISFEIGANVDTIGDGAFGGIANKNTSSSAIAFTVAADNKNFTIVRLPDYYTTGTSGNTATAHYLLMNYDKSELLAYIGRFNSEDCLNDTARAGANSFRFLLDADIAKTLRKINAYAFGGLRADKLCIPETVTYVGANFVADSNVSNVYFGSGNCEFDDKTFDGASGTLKINSFAYGNIQEFVENKGLMFYKLSNWPD